jgi:hypothetical protein
MTVSDIAWRLGRSGRLRFPATMMRQSQSTDLELHGNRGL